ncbi:unnamed protein product [Durusdinium trenchii]|uniref:Uncharacterized protein n=1 Tax=Durusdinium trenchii TaxID=1381693 RepID=A0ABP0KSU6_9DINO
MYFFWVRVALDGCEPCELWVLCRTCNHTTAMAPRVRPSKPHGSVHTAHTAAAVLRGGYAQGHGFFEESNEDRVESQPEVHIKTFTHSQLLPRILTQDARDTRGQSPG